MLENFPLVEEFPFEDPVNIFAKLPQEGALFLDSARVDANGRYSFIAAFPFSIMSCKNGIVTVDESAFPANPFEVLEKQLSQYPLARLEGLPPFQGGTAGMLGYELGGYLEKLPRSLIDDLQVPELILGFYDVVFAFDHQLMRAWVFSSGYPERTPDKRLERARLRLSFALGFLLRSETKLPSFSIHNESIHSFFDEKSYQSAVLKVIEYIRAGDIFEANISQRFEAPLPPIAPFSLYCQLRTKNPAPFGAFLQYQQWVIASASPERFLKCYQHKVEARPIKGTRPRHTCPVIDKANAEELLQSEKDWAENVMIVDLMRNDMSRVCKAHSIQVPKLCGLESFATVHHLVSVVIGELQDNKHSIDLLKATFPGGSITGAPKIRAMEIIAEIEPTLRGPYCGSIGYIGFNGDMDLSITIRTFVMNHEKITFQTGGAVTVDSFPLEEYEETLVKAKALRRTLIEP